MLRKGDTYRIVNSTLSGAYIGTTFEVIDVKEGFGTVSARFIETGQSTINSGKVLELTEHLHTFENLSRKEPRMGHGTLEFEKSKLLEQLAELDRKIEERDRVKAVDLPNGSMLRLNIGLSTNDIKDVLVMKNAEGEWFAIFPTTDGGTAPGHTPFTDEQVQGWLDGSENRNVRIMSGGPSV